MHTSENSSPSLPPVDDSVANAEQVTPETELAALTTTCEKEKESIYNNSKFYKLFAWGFNNGFKLGIFTRGNSSTSETEELIPEEAEGYNYSQLTPVPSMDGIEVVACVTGHDFGCVLSRTGEVYTYGKNDNGVLGITTQEYSMHGVRKVESISDIVSIACGCAHLVALKRDGTVYSWGSNDNMVIAGFTARFCTAPVVIPGLPQNIIQISCGRRCTYALTSDGVLYSWGDNYYGQLALELKTRGSISAPRRVPFAQTIKLVACRNFSLHVLVLDENGNVYAAGSNHEGQLGLGHAEGNINKLTRIPSLHDITFLSTLQFTSMALSKKGSIYMFGYGKYGQCGAGNTLQSTIPVEVVQGVGNIWVEQLVGGSSHVIIRGLQGQVFTFGWNEDHQCGFEDTENRLIPTEVPLFKKKRVIQLFASLAQSYAIVDARGWPPVRYIQKFSDISILSGL